MEIGDLVGVWDNGNLEGLFPGVHYGKAYAIYGDRSFFNSYVLLYLWLKFETVIPAAFYF